MKFLPALFLFLPLLGFGFEEQYDCADRTGQIEFNMERNFGFQYFEGTLCETSGSSTSCTENRSLTPLRRIREYERRFFGAGLDLRVDTFPDRVPTRFGRYSATLRDGSDIYTLRCQYNRF